MAPHAPARRRKLANDLCAQAVSASGDQNLFHDFEQRAIRRRKVVDLRVIVEETCHPGLDPGSMLV
jgi:hypothetical protein